MTWLEGIGVIVGCLCGWLIVTAAWQALNEWWRK